MYLLASSIPQAQGRLSALCPGITLSVSMSFCSVRAPFSSKTWTFNTYSMVRYPFKNFHTFPSDSEIKTQMHNKVLLGVQVSWFQTPPMTVLHWRHCWIQPLFVPRWVMFSALLGVFFCQASTPLYFFPWEKIAFLYQNLETWALSRGLSRTGNEQSSLRF